MSEHSTSATPEPRPRWERENGRDWGQTSEPTQEPADTPRGAKGAFLIGLGVIVLAAVIVLIVALV
ncbi:hypothetical protein ABZ901_18325 [Actinacidiphila alni]|uniref:hypothetical protein n=1 Tax=Actinacidiphila alni TaxID=380248 RepID=UPI0033D68235